MSCLFNSYDPYFKQPFGAVRAGQSVHLTLCTAVVLEVSHDHVRVAAAQILGDLVPMGK